VVAGRLPVNHQIVYQLQDIFNLLPDIAGGEFVEAMMVKTNDQMLVVYVASLIRSVIALHSLIGNKLTNRDAEKKESMANNNKSKDKTDGKEAGDNKDVKLKEAAAAGEKDNKGEAAKQEKMDDS
jgi:26S proteasome regulatory subunit N8